MASAWLASTRAVGDTVRSRTAREFPQRCELPQTRLLCGGGDCRSRVVLDVGHVQRHDEAVDVVPAGLDAAVADRQQHVPRLAAQRRAVAGVAAQLVPAHRHRSGHGRHLLDQRVVRRAQLLHLRDPQDLLLTTDRPTTRRRTVLLQRIGGV